MRGVRVRAGAGPGPGGLAGEVLAHEPLRVVEGYAVLLPKALMMRGRVRDGGWDRAFL